MTAAALCVRAWWGTHRVATHVLDGGLAEASVRVGAGADADLFFPGAGWASFRCAGAAHELVFSAGVVGRVVRGDEAVALGACVTRGWARARGGGGVLRLGATDVVHLEAGALRLEAFPIRRLSRAVAPLGERLDERWLTTLVAVGSLAMLWLAFTSVAPTRPVGGGAREVPPHLVHLLVKARRAPPPARVQPPRAAPKRPRAVADLAKLMLGAGGFRCLCKPCWAQCGHPVVTVPKTVRCDRGACAETEPVREVLQAHRAHALYCLRTYGHWVQEKDALRVSVDVTASGEVAAVRVAPSDTQSATVLGCLRSRVRTWHFPAASDGAYALSFQLGFWWEFPELSP